MDFRSITRSASKEYAFNIVAAFLFVQRLDALFGSIMRKERIQPLLLVRLIGKRKEEKIAAAL